jgi:murein DD-endopeptidase MepM/ murein hydrolase activator NlpD
MRNALPCVLAAAALAGLSACDGVDRSSVVATHARYVERISGFGLDRTLLGRRWNEAAERALTEPTRVVLPHAEQGALLAHEARALGFVFAASAGQTLEIGLAREAVTDAPADDGRIYIDVFRIVPDESGTRYERVGDVSVEGSTLHLPVPETADYVVRIQPELLVNTLYGLTLELGPALPFPVDGQTTSAVHSFFGDGRDAGTRLHEGIDIFAERLTPVRAVTDGRAVPRRNDLGGNVVWLNTSGGRSYYYAHLERPAVDKPRRVKAGDVLGYVGNTGNAITTPPHLHFGIYRWGRGAIDPFPELVARRLPDDAAPAGGFEPRLASTDGERLNLRAGPSTGAPVLAQLENGTIVSVRARSGDWLHVNGPARRGWIHSMYQQPLEPRGQPLQVEARFAAIVDGPAEDAQPIAVIERGDTYRTLGATGGRAAVRSGARPIVRVGQSLLAGWLAESL